MPSLARVAATPFRMLGAIGGPLLLLLAGCGGGGTYSLDTGQVAQRFLPTVRTVEHHPDSLRALSIAEEDEKVQFRLNKDYQALTQKWSSRFQSIGTGRETQSRTYATLWSLELSLVSLQPEAGLLSLRKEQARKLIEQRRAEYHETIQIDVYWFLRPGDDGIVAGPGARTELQVAGRTLRPTRTDHGPIREAYVAGGETALYRRNILHFPRTADGADVLEEASGIELTVRRTGRSSREQFAWRWGSKGQ